MNGTSLLDTGPLVAYVDQRDRFHEWALSVLEPIAPPLLTCEAVLTEACYLLRDTRGGAAAVLEMVRRGALGVAYSIMEDAVSLDAVMRKYEDAPMSLADACLVRMAEKAEGATVLTLDSHFRIYRVHGRRMIQTIMPPDA